MSVVGKAVAIASVSLVLLVVLGFLTAMAFGAASPWLIGPLVGMIALTRLAGGALRHALAPVGRRRGGAYRPRYLWLTLIYALVWPIAWLIWLRVT